MTIAIRIDQNKDLSPRNRRPLKRNIVRRIRHERTLIEAENLVLLQTLEARLLLSASSFDVSFQQGVGGYTSSSDTVIKADSPTTNFDTDTELQVDESIGGGGEGQALIRFDDLFGSGTGQIPFGAIIESAELRLYTTNPSTDGASIHALYVDEWKSDQVVWNDFDTSSGMLAEQHFVSIAESSPNPTVDEVYGNYDVTKSVQAWSYGSLENNGWAVIPEGNDGWKFASSDHATTSRRPELLVTYSLPNVVMFQAGIDGYTGTADTKIMSDSPNSNFSTSTELQVDDQVGVGGPAQSLIRFDDIIGSNEGQIPDGAFIESATLRFYTTNSSVDGGSIHRMTTSWNDATVDWNDFDATDGVKLGVHADDGADSIVTSSTSGNYAEFDVTRTLQLWTDDTLDNNGWVIMPGGDDGWKLASEDYATLAQRPQLIVEFGFLAFAASLEAVSESTEIRDGFDTFIAEHTPNTAYGQDPLLFADTSDGGFGGNPTESLLRFSIFDDETVPGSVPRGANITSAQLVLDISEDSTTGLDLIPIKDGITWDEDSVWNDFDATDGLVVGTHTLALSETDWSITSIAEIKYTIDVTETVQEWSQEVRANMGWGIIPKGGSGVDIFSLDAAMEGNRPVLLIEYDAEPISFQEGTDGYSSTSDTMVKQDEGTTNFDTDEEITVVESATAESQALIKFEDLFGTTESEVPLGSQITQATLRLYTTDPTVNPPRMLRMQENWEANTAEWDDYDATAGVKSVPHAVNWIFGVPLPDASTDEEWVEFDVTKDIQRFSLGQNSDEIFGWTIHPTGTDAWTFASSNHTDSTKRPQLVINHSTMTLMETMDDDDARFTTTGTWTELTDVDAVGGKQHEYDLVGTGVGDNTATWTFTGLKPGFYRVAASWSADTDRSEAGNFKIYDGNRLIEVHDPNLKLAPNDTLRDDEWFEFLKWDELTYSQGDDSSGTPVAITSGTLKVVLTDEDSDSGILAADAVFYEFDSDIDLAFHHLPHLQLGNAPIARTYDIDGTLVSKGSQDQAELIWQSIPAFDAIDDGSTDSYGLQYRKVGTTTWSDATVTKNEITLTGDDLTAPNLVDDRVTWSGEMIGLDFGSEYEYRITVSDLPIFENSFKTRLATGNDTPFTFVAYGDSAFNNSSQYTSGENTNAFNDVSARINFSDDLPDRDIALSILVGDNFYNKGWYFELDYRLTPEYAPAASEYTASHIDYFGWGNHEFGQSGSGPRESHDGKPSRENFSAPIPDIGQSPGSDSVLTALRDAEADGSTSFSHDYGMVHFATLDTDDSPNVSGTIGDWNAALDWLEADLDASRAHWNVVYAHHQLLDSGGAFNGNGFSDEGFLSRFADKIDLLIVGHEHTYSRSYAIDENGATDTTNGDNGIYTSGDTLLQIISGLGGRSREGIRTGSRWVGVDGRVNDEDGYLEVDVTSGVLTGRFIDARDGSVRDEFTIAHGTIESQALETTLVARASDWDYFFKETSDVFGDLTGTAWQTEDDNTFDFTNWKTAQTAPLGYGTIGSVDINGGAAGYFDIDSDDDESDNPLTSYFRQEFTVSASDLDDFIELELKIQRDDGARVFINGNEIIRSNMILDQVITKDTAAISTIGTSEESVEHLYYFKPDILSAGTNIIAVEIHQASVDSSDHVMAVELKGRKAVAEDLTKDGIVDESDVNDLVEAIRVNPADITPFDFVDDDVLDELDVNHIMETKLSSDREDVNLDGVVDGHDVDLLIDEIRKSGSHGVFDLDLDGDVDASDLDDLITHIHAQAKRGDFDLNGSVTVADVDLLRDAINENSDRGLFDINDDKVVNMDDMTKLLTDVNLLNSHMGDTDLDGDVDATDLGVWATNRNLTNKTWAQGDFDGNGTVDDADLKLLTLGTHDELTNGENLIDWTYAKVGQSDSDFDFDGSTGIIALADVTYLIETVLGAKLGDANLDGKVDIADRSTTLANDGTSGNWVDGDFDGDGTVEANPSGSDDDLDALDLNLGHGMTAQQKRDDITDILAEAAASGSNSDYDINQSGGVITTADRDQLLTHYGQDLGDLNFNGVYDYQDIDLLGQAIRDSETDDVWDLDDSGTVTSADLDELVEVLIGTEYGDTNLDGVVSVADRIGMVHTSSSPNTSWLDGNYDQDGDTDSTDLFTWKNNYTAIDDDTVVDTYTGSTISLTESDSTSTLAGHKVVTIRLEFADPPSVLTPVVGIELKLTNTSSDFADEQPNSPYTVWGVHTFDAQYNHLYVLDPDHDATQDSHFLVTPSDRSDPNHTSAFVDSADELSYGYLMKESFAQDRDIVQIAIPTTTEFTLTGRITFEDGTFLFIDDTIFNDQP